MIPHLDFGIKFGGSPCNDDEKENFTFSRLKYMHTSFFMMWLVQFTLIWLILFTSCYDVHLSEWSCLPSNQDGLRDNCNE